MLVDPSMGRRRPEAFAVADERRRIDGLGSGPGHEIAPIVERPSDPADSASNQRFRRIVGQADGDVGVPARKIEELVGQDQFYDHARIPRAKLRNDGRQNLDGHALDRGDPQLAGRLEVAARDPPLELHDGIGHAGRERNHLLAGVGRPIPVAGPLEEARVDHRLERRQPPENGRMIEAEDFRRASQRTRIRDRLDEPEFVPAELHVHGSIAVCLSSFATLPRQSTIRQVVRLAGRVLRHDRLAAVLPGRRRLTRLSERQRASACR